jgi:hypothetical protein
MLGEHPVDVMLLATDLEVAKGFYNDRIGLEVILASTSSSASPAEAIPRPRRDRRLPHPLRAPGSVAPAPGPSQRTAGLRLLRLGGGAGQPHGALSALFAQIVPGSCLGRSIPGRTVRPSEKQQDNS